MKITLLGTGTCALQGDRQPAAYLLEADGKKFLIDPGPGAIGRMAAGGNDPFTLDAILISHPHLDHISDLLYYLFAYKNGQNTRRRDVTIIAPPRFTSFFAELSAPVRRWIEADTFKTIIHELDQGEAWQTGGIKMSAARMSHGDSAAIAYRFDVSGGALVYSGDTGPCANLTALCTGADALLVECSWCDTHRGEGHMRPRDIAATAIESGAPKIILTHFYPEVDTATVADIIRKHGYQGEVIVGEDQLAVMIF